MRFRMPSLEKHTQVSSRCLTTVLLRSRDFHLINLSQLREILQKDENVKPWLETSAIAVNDKIVFSKNFKLENGDKIAILPPVCGG